MRKDSAQQLCQHSSSFRRVRIHIYNLNCPWFQWPILIQYLFQKQMEKYVCEKQIGIGAFGTVFLALNQETKEKVAIKKLKQKFQNWDEVLQLQEIKALRKLIHPNIVKLKQVIRQNQQVSLVFQYAEKDLYKLYCQLRQTGQSLTQSQIISIAKQIAQVLSFIHKQGYFHRDLKPQNVLLTKDLKVKIIDFGIAKEIRSKPPFTQYISTRWYRAPEILIRSKIYGPAIDIFSFGCLLAELYLMKPLLMGNNQLQQLSKILGLLGTPTDQEWPEGYKLGSQKKITIPQFKTNGYQNLKNLLPHASQSAINLIFGCLKVEPSKRLNSNQILLHQYFNKSTNQLDSFLINNLQHKYFSNKQAKQQKKRQGKQVKQKTKIIKLFQQNYQHQKCLEKTRVNSVIQKYPLKRNLGKFGMQSMRKI